MSVILDIDGKKTEQPDDAAIAREFESMDKSKRGGLSLIILSRGEGESLAAMGHPAEGWAGISYEHDGITEGAEISDPLSQEKTIRIFQTYARGDDSWKHEFQWDLVAGKFPTSRVIIGVAVIFALLVLARACFK